ncbi:MAG: NAD-dependent deacylase [Cellvibrionaceae bacterium]
MIQPTTNTISSIVVLTGAGISAESGIKTFRASDGLWENHRIEDVATPEAFERNPTLVHEFYNLRRQQLVNGIEPNKAHQALATFESQFLKENSKTTESNNDFQKRKKPEKSFTLITQNIDNLHEKAGSHSTIHMHGELLKARCVMSGKIFPQQVDLDSQTHCPCCNLSHTLRPHIVWFGEMPLFMGPIELALSHCDLFIAIGTSGNVYPAAGFFQIAKQSGAQTVELNLEPSVNASEFNTSVSGLATEIVPTFFNTLL